MNTLQPHDVLDIKFKTVNVCSFEETASRWVVAKVVNCSSESRPLVQLIDGQFTELRPYMEWRRVGPLRENPICDTAPVCRVSSRA